MSVRKRKWRDKQGRQHEKWMIHISHTWPDGRKQTIRKVSPVQTKRGAEQYERELRQQLLSGQWNGGKRKKTPTVAEFAEEFLAFQATINKQSVITNKKKHLRVHILPAFGKQPLDRIDERMIDAYKAAKLEQISPRTKEPYSPNTINAHVKLLMRMLRVAKKWKLISEVPDVVLLKPRMPNFDFLDFEEADRFIEAMAEHRPEWQPFVVFAVRTGLRIGEMIALRWRDGLDLTRGRVTVLRSWNPDDGFTTTKNDRIREIPLTWDAVEALRVQRARVPEACEFVFPDAKGEHIYPHTTNGALAQVATKIGFRHVHNHQLRHTFASHAVMRGIPIRQVQEWLGHSSVLVTMRYAHLARGVGDDLITRLAPEPGHAGRAARSQHTGSTQKRPTSKSPAYTPVGD